MKHLSKICLIVWCLLLATSLSVAEVAERSGYGDYRVLTKVFKKNEGITPSQYRRDFTDVLETK